MNCCVYDINWKSLLSKLSYMYMKTSRLRKLILLMVKKFFFSENVSIVIQDEIHGARLSYWQMIPFTSVVAYQARNHRSFAVVSHNLNHRKHAVCLCINIFSSNRATALKNIIYILFGYTAQFENTYNTLIYYHRRIWVSCDMTFFGYMIFFKKNCR